jgi:integrase
MNMEPFVDTENPMRDTSAPGKPERFVGDAYTMLKIQRMSEAVARVDMKAFAVISVAAFAGLRMPEVRGRRWADYDDSLTIRRSVWRAKVGEPKNVASAASVPVIPVPKEILDDYRQRVVASGKHYGLNDYIFAGQRRGAPLNLANLARRLIVPELPNTAADNQGPAVTWEGWHAFRRARATNLFSCGLPARIIQQILRHSNVSTTLSIYIQPPSDEARTALLKIENSLTNT